VSVLTSDAIGRTKSDQGLASVKSNGSDGKWSATRAGKKGVRVTTVRLPTSSSLRDCVVIRDVELRAKVFPFAQGDFSKM
jgi:hypothetical protein